MRRIAEPGAFVRYDGELMEVVAIAEGRTIHLRPVGDQPCATCQRPHDLHVLEHSRMFQEHVEPVLTVEGEPEIVGAGLRAPAGIAPIDLTDRRTSFDQPGPEVGRRDVSDYGDRYTDGSCAGAS